MVHEYWNIDEKGRTKITGNNSGIFLVPCGPNGPVEPAREKVCIASITETDLTDNVYTVTVEPATGIDGLRNNGPENITVTVANAGGNLTKVLKPNDVWDRDGLDFTTITFSAGAQFQADIMR